MLPFTAMLDSANSKPRRGRRALALWVLLLALALTAAWMWQRATQRGESDPHRGELYQRTLESVRASCFPPKPGVESYCRDQALLLLEFPECDPECVALARKIRGEPTR
jgi:hypothetical protein